MDPIKPTLTNVPEYLKQTERPKDYETALQQNEDLRFMCNAVYKAYLQYRNSMLKWQISAGVLGGICGGVICNFIILAVCNG